MEKTVEVCLDDDKFGQKGFQQRPNHQIGAVGWPRSEISSIGGGGHLRLATNWRPFGKCRINVVLSISLAMMPIIAYSAMSNGGWRNGWFTIAILVLTIGVAPNLLLLARCPEDIGLSPDPGSARLPVEPGRTAAQINEPKFTRAEALRTPCKVYVISCE